ncbi:MAG: DUF2399 domain-containing protein [Candidatus Brocadia sp.]|nr:DUF2399 domain-containing protein [Candidatus Brocadia sp.]
MITPKEIQEQCLGWWKGVLLSSSNSTSYFPREINRIGKVSSKDILSNLSTYKNSIHLLQSHSRENNKYGYKLVLEDRQFDKIGKQQVPEKIIIESIDDYLRITGKQKEYETFQKNYSLVIQELPMLLEWIKANPTRLIEHDTWFDTLKVCKYFLANPKPGLYIRQLPIDIHTKYISENESVIQSVLEFMIPEQINQNEKKFEKRFNLKYSEPLIRIRFLDNRLSPIESATDISLTLSEFNNFNSHCDNIFVAENLMNFLTLPCLPKTIAIWSGGGFNVSYLKDIDWLKSKQFYYWGDIDAPGFQILNQFRTYFTNTIAVMMDDETLASFKSGEGRPATNQTLQRLTKTELNLYNHLRQNNIRLEQEKITQTFAEKKIKKLFQEHPSYYDK